MTVAGLKTGVVYIVDDDDAVRKALARLLRSAGLQAQAFESSNALFAQVAGQRPACILLDMTMPQLTGLQVQEQLKRQGIDVPVIAVSARDDDDTRARARALGAKLFLRKPVDDQALLDAIAKVTLRP